MNNHLGEVFRRPSSSILINRKEKKTVSFISALIVEFNEIARTHNAIFFFIILIARIIVIACTSCRTF